MQLLNSIACTCIRPNTVQRNSQHGVPNRQPGANRFLIDIRCIHNAVADAQLIGSDESDPIP
jgi:hypothetical protein